MILSCKDKKLDLSVPNIMGILNITPDSFSDGGLFFDVENALLQAHKMIKDGADILDIGGESTRPAAAEVTVAEEIKRVVPVIEALRDITVPISVDTSKPEVMMAAISAGAAMINDVNALRTEGALAVAAELEVPVCLMHMQGTPRTMQQAPQYQNVIEEIKVFLSERIEHALSAGIKEQNIMIDPGFGFGKNIQHNLLILQKLAEFVKLKQPLLIGLSRKRFLAEISGKELSGRMPASLAAAMLAAQKGANILRVHDVAETRDMLKVLKVVQ